MGRAPLSASAFALAAGAPADPRAFVHAETLPDGRLIALAVEPLDRSDRGIERGRFAMRAIRDALSADDAIDPSATMRRAFVGANAALVADNWAPSGDSRNQPSYVGATAALVDGRKVTLAQTPPAQAILIQDHRAYALPRLASWRHDYVPAADQESEPFGVDERFLPIVLTSRQASGDLLVLCSSSIGRLLGRRKAGERLVRDPAFLEGDPASALDLLESAVAASQLDDAFAATIALGTQRSRTKRRRRPAPRAAAGPSPSSSGQATNTPTSAADWHRPLGTTGPLVDADLALGAQAHQAVRGTEDATRSTVNRIGGGAIELQRGKVGARLRAFHLPGARSGSPPRSNQPAFAAPGAGSVRRYVSPSATPAEWRASLPRGPEMHVSSRWLTVGLIALVGLGGGRVYLDRQFDRAIRGEDAVVRFDRALLAATNDPAGGAAEIERAEAALDEAMGYGISPEALALRIATLDTARDHAWQIERLESAERIGVIPAPLVGRPLRLLTSGGRTYLVGDAVYSIDADARYLVEAVAPGADVGGLRLGAIQAAATDGSRLLVTDGAAAVQILPDGTTRNVALGGLGAFDWSGRPAAAFDGNLYGLSSDGRILKFGRDGAAPPEAWTGPNAVPELTRGRDMAIDGRISVLLDDGRLLTFFRGEETTVATPNVQPPLERPAFFASTGAAGALYVVEPTIQVGGATGRIVRLMADGSTRQFVVPAATKRESGLSSILARAQSVAIDEATGSVVIATDDELWRARLPTRIEPTIETRV